METALRLGAFFGIFLAMALWERGVPMRALAVSRLRRWGTNWAISILDAVMVRLPFGAAAAGAALDAAAGGLGPVQPARLARLRWSLAFPFRK